MPSDSVKYKDGFASGTARRIHALLQQKQAQHALEYLFDEGLYFCHGLRRRYRADDHLTDQLHDAAVGEGITQDMRQLAALISIAIAVGTGGRDRGSALFRRQATP